jgi:hypothetical protein
VTACSKVIHDCGKPWAESFKTFTDASIQQFKKTTDTKSSVSILLLKSESRRQRDRAQSQYTLLH